MRIQLAHVLSIAAAIGVAQSANAATVANGSFESGIAPGTFTTVPGGDTTSITNWTVGGASVDYIGSYWQAADGSRSIDLAGSGIGSISQNIATTAGQHYRVTFDVARNPDSGLNPRTGFVDAGGAPTLITYNNPTSTKSDMQWATRIFDFTAAGGTTTLRFSADPTTSGCCFGLALDNVSIAALPEPTTWSLMILGVGLVGLGMRRRQAVRFNFG